MQTITDEEVMRMPEDYKYCIDLSVNKKLSETEKNKLFVALANTVKSVLGKPTGDGTGGAIFIHSEKE